MEFKRSLGLVVLAGGVLLMLAGLDSIDSASPVAGHGDHWTSWSILGGALLARIGAILNPVGGNSVTD